MKQRKPQVVRYQVTSYSDGLWCIVDFDKFLDATARENCWPMQVHEHPVTGDWVFPFKSREDAQRVADEMNANDAACAV